MDWTPRRLQQSRTADEFRIVIDQSDGSCYQAGDGENAEFDNASDRFVLDSSLSEENSDDGSLDWNNLDDNEALDGQSLLEKNVKTCLVDWVVECNIPRSHVNNLLKRLNNDAGLKYLPLGKGIKKEIRKYIPRNFGRKTRRIEELPHLKATELRLDLLYICPVSYKPFLSIRRYKHLMLLHVGIKLLVNRDSCQTNAMYADKLLRQYVTAIVKLYAPNMYPLTCIISFVLQTMH